MSTHDEQLEPALSEKQHWLLDNIHTWKEPDYRYLIFNELFTHKHYYTNKLENQYESEMLTREKFIELKLTRSEWFESCSETKTGDRFNANKPPLSIVLEAQHALEGCAKILAFGAEKYDRGNWRKGLSHTQICDSLLRHLSAYLAGENNDKESGLPHVDHVLCNALFLAEMVKIRPDLNDRSEVNNG